MRALGPATLSIMAVSLAVTAPQACAERAVTVTPQGGAGYQRAVLGWADGGADGPAVTAAVSDQVLILRFSEAITIDLDALRTALGAGSSPARRTGDGREVRVALGRDALARATISANRTAVDLWPDGGAAPAAYTSERAQSDAAAAAEAARIAALPPPPPPAVEVNVALLELPDRTRVSLLWPQTTAYRFSRLAPDQVQLVFQRPARADIVRLKTAASPRVTDARATPSDRAWTLVLTHPPELDVSHFQEDGAVQIDFAPRRTLAGPTPPAAASAAPATNADPVPSVAAPTAIRLSPPVTKADLARMAAEGGAARTRETVVDAAAPLVSAGTVRVEASRVGGGAELRFPFQQSVAAAVYERDGFAHIVFGARGTLDLSAVARAGGIPAVEALSAPDLLVARVPLTEGQVVTAEAAGTLWRVRIGGTALQPVAYLEPRTSAQRSGGPQLEIVLGAAARLGTLEDPVRGDRVAVALLQGPARAVAQGRSFIDGAVLKGAQGVAVALRADGVEARLEDGALVIGGQGGLRISQAAAPAAQRIPRNIVTPGFIDFEGWALGPEREIWSWRQRLEREAAEAEPARRGEALLRLARFFVAHDLAAEALGTLRLAVEARPALDSQPEAAAVRLAANTMMGRHKEAREDLRRATLMEDPAAHLWGGQIAVAEGDWPRAAEAFERARSVIPALPTRWAGRLQALTARAAMEVGDLSAAQAYLAAATETAASGTEDLIALYGARLKALRGDRAGALTDLTRLAARAAEPVSIEAEMLRVETALALGQIKRTEAIDALEALRFRWRGDALELEIIERSSALMLADGRVREGLSLAQSAGLRSGDLPPARRMRVRLVDDFARLFLEGGVDRLDPIQALAIYYEFKDLTPIGADGDRMIRRLANRLVAFDLLEPAAELLSHQVENRLRGRPQAEVGSDLAAIFIMDGKPEQALQALAASRQPQLDAPLREERRLVEAAAYMGQRRFGLAEELLEGITGEDANRLRAEIAWRAREWPKAATALAATLPAPGGTLADGDRETLVRTAIALRFAEDRAGLRALRERWMGQFAGGRHAPTFAYLTGEADITGADLGEAARRVADLGTVNAFIEGLKARFDEGTPTAAAPA